MVIKVVEVHVLGVERMNREGSPYVDGGEESQDQTPGGTEGSETPQQLKRRQWLRNKKIPSYTSSENVTYRPGDSVFIVNKHTNRPFHVCTIQEFRLTRRDDLVMIAKCFFRPSEVPDSVYQSLVQDRVHEVTCSGYELKIQQPLVKSRELFISYTCDTFPVSNIRGKCTVIHYQDIFAVRDFQPLPDTFFYIFRYNSETKRLATTQGEIRVGPSHQARLPEYKPNVMPANMPEKPELLEKMLWQPSCIMDGDLMMYLRAARSMAAYAGMCNGGSTEEGFIAASLDDTTGNALNTLHHNSYDTGKSLQALVRCPVPRSVEKKWNEEEAKRFVKGLRQYGKNFFKIRRELLQHKETCELVEYYYFWKKTPAATTARPHRRHRRQSIFRRQTAATRNNTRPASCEFLDLSSASEVSDVESGDDSDSRDLTGYTCRHCFTTTSKDWHHAGKERTLLCTECRLHFKKYGEERPIDKKEPSPFLFKPVVSDEEALGGKHTMRTRRNRDSSNGSKGRGKKNCTPDENIENIDSPVNSTCSQKVSSGHQSPSTVSTCSNSSTEKEEKKLAKEKDEYEDGLLPVDGLKKRPHSDSESDDTKQIKKKKERSESLSESTTDSSSLCGNDENQIEDIETENNQDELMSSPSLPEVPSPTPVEPQNDIDNTCKSPVEIKQEIDDSQHSIISIRSSVISTPPPQLPPEASLPHSLMQLGLPFPPPSHNTVPPLQSQTEVPSPSTTPQPSRPSSQPSLSQASLAPQSAPPPLAPSMNQPPVTSLPVQLPIPSQLPPPPPLVQQPPMMPSSLPSITSTPPPPLHPDHMRSDHLRVDVHRSDPYRPDPLHSDSMRPDPLRSEPLRPESLRTEPVRPDALRPDPMRPEATMRPDPLRSDLRPDPLRPDSIHTDPHRVDSMRTDPLRPDSLRPDTLRPDTMRPDALRPDTMRPDPMRSDPMRSDPMRSDPMRSDPMRSDPMRSDPMRSDPMRSDPMRSDPMRSDSLRTDSVRPEPLRSEALRPEVLRSDPMQPDSLRTDPLRPDVLRTDPMRSESLRNDSMRPDSMRSGPLRPDVIRSEPMRPETIRSDSMRSELRPDPMRPDSLRTDKLRPDYRPDHIRSDSVRQDYARAHPMRTDPLIRPEPLRGEQIKQEPRDLHNSRTPDPEPYDSPVTPEPVRTPSPGPDPIVVNEDHHKSRSALFIKILSRGETNSCSRCDLVFRPLPDSKLARRREERMKRAADTPIKIKEEMKEKEEKCARKAETPPPNSTADAQITSSFSNQPSTPYNDRHTPRSQVYPGHDTPALRQLSEYARPHALGQEVPRSLPYNLASMQPSMDPMLHYRMASMYPPGSRERLELDLEREKRERDAREREIRERELREMELREKMKAELEMKPPGFDRLPQGGNPIDSHWLELQRRYAMSAAQGGHLAQVPGGQHIPGVYPPSSLASDLLARERERLERLGVPMNHPLVQENPFSSQVERLSAERLHAERMALATDPMIRLQMAGMSAAAAAAHAHQHTHAHSHTHLHLHGQESGGQGPFPGGPPVLPPLAPDPVRSDQIADMTGGNMTIYQIFAQRYTNIYHQYNNANSPFKTVDGRPLDPSHLVYQFSRADPLAGNQALSQAAAAAAAANHPLAAHHPYGHHPLIMGREREMLAAQHQEMMSRQYDPALAHQLSAQAAHHEAIQRQLAMERERLSGHPMQH